MTPEEIAKKHLLDIVMTPDLAIDQDDIDNLAHYIAAAVSAERERCAKVAEGIWHLKDVDGVDIEHVVTDPIADAIRALK